MKKILALLGDYYHPADYLSTGLQEVLGEGYSLQIKKDYQNIDWAKLSEYDIFLLAAEGKIKPEESDNIWLTAAAEKAIIDFVTAGGGLFVFHCGLADYPVNGSLRELIKGHFIQHPAEHPEIEVKTAIEHPLTVGIEEFKIIDEQYFVEVDEEDTNIFLTASSEEFGGSLAGWYHNYGQGKVCCLTPGHTLEVLREKMMQRLIINSVNWL